MLISLDQGFLVPILQMSAIPAARAQMFPAHSVAWQLELGEVCYHFAQLSSHSATDSKGHSLPIGSPKGKLTSESQAT